MTRRLVLGLTGGIGSGKSAVSERLGELGAAIVDTDRIAHALTAPDGACIPALRETFGAAAIDASGGLDRKAMRERAFADPDIRFRLEALLHPRIRAAAQAAVTESDAPVVVLVVPLLVEAPDGYWLHQCDLVAVVDCPEDIQIQRVMRLSGLDESGVRAILAAQASRAERCAAAHVIIDNSGDFDSLRTQVDALYARCLQTMEVKS